MRELTWDGYPNARDLGGLPTTASPTGTTRFGRVARGPRRELLTAHGWLQARRWGLATAVDLRCGDEIGSRPGDPDHGIDVDLGDGTVTAGVTIVHAPTEDHDVDEFRAVCFPILDSPEYWPHNWRILPDLVRGALEIIADADPGVLVHCSAGRDRTGMISTLLLANAGVAPDDVAGDYAQSVRAMAGVASHSPTHDRQATWSARQVDDWITTTAPLVRDSASKVQDAFDTVGLPETSRRRLRDLLTR